MASSRNDVQGVERAPRSIDTYLERKGGKNVYGEPIFRLVFSTNRLMKRGGKFNDWDKNIKAKERGGVVRLNSGLLVPNGYRPIRSVIEIRTVKKYPALAPGWVLERWVPRAYYGNRGDWESRCVPGTSIPLLGPYPVEGDYEMCGYFGGQGFPSIEWLSDKIDRCEKSRNEHKENTRQAYLERMDEAVAEYEKQEEKDRQESQAIIDDLLKPLWSSSLTAGVLRNQLARQAGITEHVGN